MACAETYFPLLQQETLVQLSHLIARESKPTSCGRVVYIQVLSTSLLLGTGSVNTTLVPGIIQRLTRENR
jgi:hypothetical protein